MRKNALHINQLYEECKYILENEIKSEKELLEKQNILRKKETELLYRRSSLSSVEDKEILRQYRVLKKQLMDTPAWDNQYESYQEELDIFIKQMPEGMLQIGNEKKQINAMLKKVRHEKRIVNRLIEDEKERNKEQKISMT